MSNFSLQSEYQPAGDQPRAIEGLLRGLSEGMSKQTLLGATATGKTFTIANVIEKYDKPTLVIAHNKTLAAQLAQEFREFFPKSAVHYFVSYYDYYQPEAYMPSTDTYIEKDASINEEIERLRHATTQALLTRRDVIIVASVSCIYGLGSPEEYEKEHMKILKGMKIERNQLLRKLVSVFFTRTNADLTPGTFRAIGNNVEIMPTSERVVYSLDIEDGKVSRIQEIDPVSMRLLEERESLFLFPAKHFITDKNKLESALVVIKKEMEAQVKKFRDEGKSLEAERIERRTVEDIAMIREVGYCSGIENYSRHLSGRNEGEAPDTLLSYFPKSRDGSADFLTIIDESHVTIPQLEGMYAGDRSRKNTLVEYGFRLPSAKDNRPLRYEEFEQRIGQVIYTSATPSRKEREESDQIVEQIIRPTGLLDPIVLVRPVKEEGAYKGQVQDVITEIEETVAKGSRVLVTTLTKKMAEDLSSYLKDRKVKAEYLHSDILTLDRITLISKFRRGEFDCIVGVNLLREGLDLPEVSFIGILDADKEGFLRSDTSLIQTIGRAARNSAGRVILYADRVTGSMQRAMDETNRRREKQEAHNKVYGITPKTIKKAVKDIAEEIEARRNIIAKASVKLEKELTHLDVRKLLRRKEKQMNSAAKILDFETAALLRDEIKELEKLHQNG
ncbi:MAG: excinuclease ABC subunit B [Candidatus Vogelbacteria bacterium CG10_big_fil_rev_8_21_14_0_10_45_14]|uniref:UvrABC system protein B n=1 Tax=Candidatus Vogelbacteria bacterium CG10_big_fil_rev_8_21_14_0_10_45_14 TaxID=1975042 RepID=A0A2H0RIX1_9BACT|nr:MAG: excinuclease ABC subunit B [Candidatus Vogelbacteria bacterium CG10_big_fil_rev_8_21_14_0_10_45_14]